MHYCLLVFHREDQNVIDMVERYCDDCGSYTGTLSMKFKDDDDGTKTEEAIEILKKAYEPLFYPLEIGVDEDDDKYIIYAYGKCDWFAIGGRCDKTLVDKNDGSKNFIIKAKDVDIEKSILLDCANSYMLPDGEWHELEDEFNVRVMQINDLFDEAAKEDLYVTVVDYHN